MSGIGWHQRKLVPFALAGFLALTAPGLAEEPPPFLTQWPMGVGYALATDPSGNFYLGGRPSLGGQQSVTVYSSRGTWLSEWNVPAPVYDIAIDPAGIYAYVADTTWISQYSIPSGNLLNSWLSDTSGLSVDASGNVLAVEAGAVVTYSADGTLLNQWPAAGGGYMGLAVGPSGNIYATDYSNAEVEVYDAMGTLLDTWSHGFNLAITVDSSENVYVTDDWNDRVLKLDASGNLLAQWGSSGTGENEFLKPWGIALGTEGEVVVVDHYNARIQMFGDAPPNLAADLATVSLGGSATLRTFGGEASGQVVLFVMEVDGTPFFLSLANGFLDQYGHWTLTRTIPNDPQLVGVNFVLRDYTFDEFGGVVATNDQGMSIQ